MQQKFEKIRDLLVREKWDELTADERQMLEEWRQEEESHEQLYRRLAEPGALRRHFDELAAVDTERALAVKHGYKFGCYGDSLLIVD